MPRVRGGGAVGAAMNDDERRLLAVHECGHAIFHLAFDIPLRSVSIVSNEDTLGRITPRHNRRPEPQSEPAMPGTGAPPSD
jgi:ATP-dependent Zn protease